MSFTENVHRQRRHRAEELARWARFGSHLNFHRGGHSLEEISKAGKISVADLMMIEVGDLPPPKPKQVRLIEEFLGLKPGILNDLANPMILRVQ